MPRKYKTLPDLALLKQHFTCQPEQGTLTRLSKRMGSKNPVGSIIKGAATYYRVVHINGGHYLLSRIIWLMVTGEDPGEYQVDHVDGDISNNCFSNLRTVTQGQNNINRRTWSASGHKGVYIRHNRNGDVRYYVQIHRTKGRRDDGTYIRHTTQHGSYTTIEDAVAAYDAALLALDADALQYTRAPRTAEATAVCSLLNVSEVVSALKATSYHGALAVLSGLTAPEILTVEVALMALGVEVTHTGTEALYDALYAAQQHGWFDGELDAFSDEDASDDDDYMDGDHASALSSAGWGDEAYGYEAGDWL